MRVCIIGAGSSGMVCAKVLQERGLPFDCFEKGSGVGGNWRYENDNGASAAYASLHIDTSRDRMAYSDFPMPADYPDYPHHSQVLAYFEAYARHFGLRDRITFGTEVTRVVPAHGGGYDVTVRALGTGDERTERYGAVVVANGHHWLPNRPTFPGSFDGLVMHSHDYRTPDVLRGRRVLVVGVGNSGSDIACEAAGVADATFLSTRRGAHILPKYLGGRPLDAWVTPLGSRLPIGLQRFLLRTGLRLARGRQEDYGFPVPPYPFGSEHPTMSSRLLRLVKEGRIRVKPNVSALAEGRVRFDDGTEEAVDVIVYATGYRIAFPFFDESFLRVEGNYVPLYLRVVPPACPDLYFIGLIQPLGAVMPLAERQAAWVADLLEGRGGLPSRQAMERWIRRADERLRRRYVSSPRHTIQVDFFPYQRELERERRRARRYPPLQRLQVTG